MYLSWFKSPKEKPCCIEFTKNVLEKMFSFTSSVQLPSATNLTFYLKSKFDIKDNVVWNLCIAIWDGLSFSQKPKDSKFLQMTQLSTHCTLSLVVSILSVYYQRLLYPQRYLDLKFKFRSIVYDHSLVLSD